ncbi:TIGR02680 family protein [Georgenia sp. M64]|uniref:TIGR02680 family protein n=1 Tax=Georgenia sp. M64 TaxID=3120520 RepID=UPI0030E4C9F0
MMDPGRWLAAQATGALPLPTRQRWQPLRVGIVNLWEYDRAEFWCADGRLILRGANGSGKTKVLELTTLMLLRGEIAPAVLDPFGSRNRTMGYNLLASGQGDDPRPVVDAATGYSWVEFGRLDDHGDPQFVVAGVGASARRAAGNPAITSWRFVTHLRPGRDLELVQDRRVLPEKELRALPGMTVFSSAAAYRERLSTEIFGLSAGAYDNLTNLLRELRVPKLGERLNPATLAATLRDALPPLASHEVSQLADGWDGLESLRERMAQTERAARAVARYVADSWRPWARAVVEQRASEMAVATSRLDRTTRDRRQAQESLTASEALVETTRVDEAEAGAELQRQRAALAELMESEAYRDAQQAEHRVTSLRDETRRLTTQAEDAATRLAAAERDRTDVASRHAGAEDRLTEAVDARERAADLLHGTAGPAGVVVTLPEDALTAALHALRATVQRRSERLRHLRTLSAEHQRAARTAEGSGTELSTREADLAGAQHDADGRADALDAAVSSLQSALVTWAGQLRELDGAAWLPRWEDAVAQLDVPNSDPPVLRDLVDEATTSPRQLLTAELGRLTAVRSEIDRRLDRTVEDLRRERSTTEQSVPEPVGWRRRERPASGPHGAPFWRCVEPVGLDDDAAATLEAALAAAGVLDAWVSETGALLSAPDGAAEAEVVLRPGTHVDGPTLTAVLAPAEGCPLPGETVTALLAAIGWGRPPEPADTWFDPDGTWSLGPLTGRAAPLQPASYLGATAREAARLRRIALLEMQERDLRADLGAASRALQGVRDRLARLDTEVRTVPVDHDARAARTALASALRAVADAEQRAAATRRRHEENLGAVSQARAALTRYASEHGFSPDDVPAQEEALRAFSEALERLGHAVAIEDERRRAAADAHDALDVATARVAVENEGRARRVAELEECRTRLHTLERMMRKDHSEVLAERQRIDDHVRELETSVRELGQTLLAATVEAEKARGVLDRHEEAYVEAEGRRDRAMAAWWVAADAGLLSALEIDAPERHTVETARVSARAARGSLSVSADELAAAVDRAWRSCFAATARLAEELATERDARHRQEADAVLQGFEILADPDAGWQRPDLAEQSLTEQLHRQRAHFDEEQHRVLATLLGSTFIEHLKERLDYTQRTFTRINDRLAEHPTRQGQSVRLRWEPDSQDPEAGQVIHALSRGFDQLTAERQEQVRQFLSRRIEDARDNAEADGQDWRESLHHALDYRTWLRITLQYRAGRESAWVPFDAATHGSKSGGEKVVLLSQPLFAAAVVAYDSALPTAPRWVWLDEAMTGVDAELKASFLGLTVDFDLDLMLTAHDEWGTYPSVPAVAIYDLAREKGFPGVDSVVYLWAGGRRVRVADVAAGPGTSAAAVDVESELDLEGARG